MNRRDLFRGAGAAALAAVAPSLPAEPFTGLTPVWVGPDAEGTSALWLVSWANTEPRTIQWTDSQDPTEW